MPPRFIRAPAVASRTGHSVRTVKRKAADPRDSFPAGLRIADRITVWIEDEIDAWIDRALPPPRCRPGRGVPRASGAVAR
jgi:predicted DNA-binding transcriptional regulator AlpA